MPRFQIIEKRALYSGVIIESRDEEAAQKYDGEIIDEQETDTWADSLHSFEQVADDCEEVSLP